MKCFTCKQECRNYAEYKYHAHDHWWDVSFCPKHWKRDLKALVQTAQIVLDALLMDTRF